MSDYQQNRPHDQSTPSDPTRLDKHVASLEQENAQLKQQLVIYTRELEAVDQTLQHLNALHQQMQHEHRRFQALIENSSDFIGMVTLDGQPLYLNQAGWVLVGLESDEQFAHTSMLEYIYPDDRADFQAHILPVIMQQGRWEGELRFQHFQREEAIPVWYSAFLVLDVQTRQPLALGTVTRDLTVHKRTEAKMQQNKKRLELILDATNDGIWDWFLSTNAVYYSPRWQTMLGYEPGELVGHLSTWEDLVHPDDLPHMRQVIMEHMQGHTPAFASEFRMRTKAGTWIWILGRGKVVTRDATGSPLRIVGTHTDISHRRQTEEALRLTQFALDHAADAIFWTDLAGHILYANDAACQSLGYSREEWLGLQISQIDPGFTGEAVVATTQVIEQYGSMLLETHYRHKDGHAFPVEVTVSHLVYEGTDYLHASMRDITERKQIEKQLRLAQFTLDQAVDGIHWLNREGRQIYVNDALCQRLGYTQNEMLAMNILDLDPNVPQDRWHTVWHEMQKTGMDTFETVHRRKDGHLVPVEVTASFLTLDDTEYICSILRDTTERKQAEAERLALHEQIIAVQRAAIRELSTPLIPITESAVVMPLIGTIDSARAKQVLETLLEGVTSHQANLAILDITGVQMVDTQVANALIGAAKAVRLLGAQVMIKGIQPQIAQTLVHLGIDLHGIMTYGTLQAGIAAALQQGHRAAPGHPGLRTTTWPWGMSMSE